MNFMFLRKLKKKKMRYQTEVFLFLLFFSVCLRCSLISLALLTIIRTKKQLETQISMVSNINKITFMSSCRNQDETRERKKEREEGGGWWVGGENGSWDWREDLISLCSLFFGITFLQAKIC